MLSRARVRPFGVEALASFGDRIAGTLADVLLDRSTPASVRRQIPRVLRSIPTQRSVDVLFSALDEPDLTVRSAVLKGLNSLRENHPKLNYGRESLTRQILNEARYYYEMSAAMAPFRQSHETRAARLLHETLEERLEGALERLFRLLGLKYPQREIYAAYLAVNRRKSDEYTAAVEFLDNVLERDMKRYVMPLLDEDTRTAQTGRELFNVPETDSAGAVRTLLRSGDSWLVACAVATAAELRLPGLRPEIEALAAKSGTEVGLVAQSALAALT
jgi:AAA family ATP:ADP antiporter